MAADIPDVGAVRDLSRRNIGFEFPHDLLRRLAIAAGIFSGVAFVPVGLWFQFQLYGDGAIFSYMVAAEDGWAFHWHNIAGRLFVYLYSTVPAETYVGLTGDVRGGIALYGFLFYAAPLLGLIAAFVADRSPNRAIFGFACASTAILCPMVFGFPTEIWVAHALFWPSLAICHFARNTVSGFVLSFVALLALVLTHLGALIFAATILASLLMRGMNASFFRSSGAFCAALVAWAGVVSMFPPDSYFVGVLIRAAKHVFDVNILFGSLAVLLAATLASYAAAVLMLRRLAPTKAYVHAVLLVAGGLCVFWLWSGGEVHGEGRYYLRTALILFTPTLGALAAFLAFEPAAWFVRLFPFVPRLRAALVGNAAARFAQGALALVVLVHAVETAKFAGAWTEYKAAVAQFAASSLSDASLGDPRFVSSARIAQGVQPLGWDSTTPYLSVLLAPRFNPVRLVVNPAPGYFWLPCTRAAANAKASRALPPSSRELIRVYSCLHRPQ